MTPALLSPDAVTTHLSITYDTGVVCRPELTTALS